MSAPARAEQPAPPSASSRIEGAQAELQQANARLAELNEQRNAALLKDDNATAIALGIEATNLRLTTRAIEDKITLLREQAAREDQERRAQERERVIEGIEKKIEKRDAAMADVAAAIKQLAVASEKAIKLGRDVVNEWTWQAHDLPAALLTPPSILTAISHEFYKLSYHPRRYGGMDTDPLAGHMLPGSRCPRLEWTEQPERTRAMVDVVKEASEFARRFLRTGKGSAAVAPTLAENPPEMAVNPPPTNGGNAPQRTDAEQRLSDLRVRMAKLAEDQSPQGEAEYLRVVDEMAKVHAEVAAEKQMERQHG
jgi:hypothetical protein